MARGHISLIKQHTKAATMTVTRKHTVPHTLKPSEHPYLTGPWTPNFDEIDAEDMPVIGTIPSEIDGIYTVDDTH